MENSVTISLEEYEGLKVIKDQFDAKVAEEVEVRTKDAIAAVAKLAEELGRCKERENESKRQLDEAHDACDAWGEDLARADRRIAGLDAHVLRLNDHASELEDKISKLEDRLLEADRLRRDAEWARAKADGTVMKLTQALADLRSRGLWARVFRKGE